MKYRITPRAELKLMLRKYFIFAGIDLSNNENIKDACRNMSSFINKEQKQMYRLGVAGIKGGEAGRAIRKCMLNLEMNRGTDAKK